ncbi:MAG: aldose epimerase family protein [Christensenellales bacterium]|mgnify:CR=1 FL=1|jgi:aldose 1-epimerase|nr:galactose mutarotase [Clostridiales bacterium]
MAITIRPFGIDSLGRRINCYTMENRHGYSVSIINYGASIQSIKVPDRCGKIEDVVLGFDTLEGYQNNTAYIGATIGRVCNRIDGASYDYEGKRYTLDANDGLNTLHGGREGFHGKFWIAQTTEGEGRDFVTMYLNSHAGEGGFPGSMRTQVVFSFGDDNRLEINYLATASEDTPVNLTNHSYFNLSGKGTIKDHVLSVDAPTFLDVNEENIPLGTVHTVENTVYDLRSPVLIEKAIKTGNHPTFKRQKGFDVSFRLSGKGLREVAMLHHPDSGRTIRVRTDQPALQVYSGQFLNEQGKGGAHHGAYAGIALETQHEPDALHQPSFRSIILKAGDTYHTQTCYAFSVE